MTTAKSGIICNFTNFLQQFFFSKKQQRAALYQEVAGSSLVVGVMSEAYSAISFSLKLDICWSVDIIIWQGWYIFIKVPTIYYY